MIPRITVLNNRDGYLTTIDNSRPESLHFSNEFLTLYHLNSASTFEATFNKVTNGKINPDAQHLINGNKLTMRYAEDDYYFNIVDTDEDEFTIKVTALGAPLELTNAERDAYEANGNMTWKRISRNSISKIFSTFEKMKSLIVKRNYLYQAKQCYSDYIH